MITTGPLVTATVAERTRAEEIRLDVTDAPPIEVRSHGAREIFLPTGLRITYDGTATKAITILTTTEPLWVRLDRDEDEPVEPWVTALVDEYRPDPRETDRARAWAVVAEIVERARTKGVTELDTDRIAEALGLDEDDEREPDVDGAGRTRAEYDPPVQVDPCFPYQRYGCGHCRHQDCPNPDCGHCPCKCDCR
jgi:hypothetical protein